MSQLNHPGLVDLILAALDKLLHVEKGQVMEAEGVKLHPSEIHLLLFLHANPTTSATGIAHRFGVTKGAVSQNLARLESKGVISKSRGSGPQGELSIALTDLGERLMPHVVRIKEAAASRFDSHLSTLSPEEREAVGRFFQEVLGERHP